MTVDTKTFGGPFDERIKNISFARVLLWVVVGLIMIVSLFPFWWVVRTAFARPPVVPARAQDHRPVSSLGSPPFNPICPDPTARG
jgi:ABC-type glycerol-3-phosphate transport system permease component